jgi:hypothetical protein
MDSPKGSDKAICVEFGVFELGFWIFVGQEVVAGDFEKSSTWIYMVVRVVSPDCTLSQNPSTRGSTFGGLSGSEEGEGGGDQR